MRTIRTFILRLFIDPSQPAQLRGAIQALPEGEAQSFSNGKDLINELSKMVAPGESASGVSVAPDAGALAAVRRWFEGFVHWLRRLMHQS